MKNKTIILDHGSGGLASQQLINDLFLRYLDNPILAAMEDSAVLPCRADRIAFSTDSYVVDPLFFPGGDIGTLAVHGTLNDLAMRGARPLWLSLAFILEEGLEMAVLERVIQSVANSAKDANVPIVTGDTKVVPRGKADKIFINTSGVGEIDKGVEIDSRQARAGDVVILSGTMADHGITIMTSRAGLALEGSLQSDSAALHHMVDQLLTGLDSGAIHTMRDPTRGGVATALNEVAGAAQLLIELEEQDLPIRAPVNAACEILGLDPLYLANEGKALIVVDPACVEQALTILHDCEEGKEAVVIGRLLPGKSGQVVMKTPLGGTRIVPPLHGEPLPRIC